MGFKEIYENFEIMVENDLLMIKDLETNEEGKIDVKNKDMSSIKKMAHFVINKRINEKRAKEKNQLVQFTLELRSGDRYDHSYFVPEKVVKAGRDEIEKYIILEALGDLIYVDIEEVDSDVE